MLPRHKLKKKCDGSIIYIKEAKIAPNKSEGPKSHNHDTRGANSSIKPRLIGTRYSINQK